MSPRTCVPGSVRCRDSLGLVSYTEGVENKVDKANLEQCNLKFKYQDANEALLSFPPPNDFVSLSTQLVCHSPCTKLWSLTTCTVLARGLAGLLRSG